LPSLELSLTSSDFFFSLRLSFFVNRLLLVCIVSWASYESWECSKQSLWPAMTIKKTKLDFLLYEKNNEKVVCLFKIRFSLESLVVVLELMMGSSKKQESVAS
jgi:hypothetical protein